MEEIGHDIQIKCAKPAHVDCCVNCDDRQRVHA